MPDRVGDLEIEQDMGFQQVVWAVSRVAWVVMALFILAGLAGVLGSGAVSGVEAGGAEEGIRVHYDRIVRVLAPGSIEVRLDPGAAAGKELRLTLAGDHLKKLQLERIEPEPSSAEIGADGITYTFNLNQPGQVGSIIFYGRPQQVGGLNGSIGLEQKKPVSLKQLVLP